MSIAPILVWLLAQLAALLLASGRVPLAAQYPQPGEFQAVRVMLAAQFAALAILFPWMLRTWGAALAAAAAGWAMLFAAALLGGWTIRDVVPPCLFVTAWIAIFTTCAQIRSAKFQSVIMAVACTIVLGGPLVWYLQLEFATGLPVAPGPYFGPLPTALATMPHLPPSAWAAACGAELFALLVWKAASWPRKKAIPPQSDAPMDSKSRPFETSY